MLTELRIKNVAIIESLTLPLAPGFNALSGETGAGKSIIVGALGLLLGERSSPEMIRTGADRATVEGVFDASGRPDVMALLDERGIDAEDGQIVLKRELSAAGRTRAWINGTTVTTAVLALIGRSVVNLRGQHEAQSLVDPDTQRRILDAFGGASALATEVRAAFEQWSLVRREIAELTRRRAEAQQRADYLRHVAGEIEGAHLTPGDEGRLADEVRRLENAEELQSLAGAVAGALDGSGDADGVIAHLDGVRRALSGLHRIDSAVGRLVELFDSAYYALSELAREADGYGRRVDLDPARLAEVQRRRDLVYRLIQKYGPTVDEVLETGRRARRELDLVDSAAFDLRQMEARESAARDRLVSTSAALTAAREGASRRLAGAVDGLLPELGLPDGHFTVGLARVAELTADGAEDIEFRVTLNVGHDARPLARVASGGELSRIMLALTTILARLDGIPTLVFDEVDAGIGGGVGLQVGAMLRRAAANHQVVAISHLPQIAAAAHHHIVVSKGPRGGVTAADVTVVTGEARVREVARMLGGDADREVSRAHARELLAAADATSGPPGGNEGGLGAALEAAGTARAARARGRGRPPRAEPRP
jgi:DNA repair protein RecN (Recombination protein N)